MNRPMRSIPVPRVILLVAMAVVVTFGGVSAYQRSRATAAEPGVLVAPQRGSIAATTMAARNLVAREVRLSFATSGVLSEMLVKVGDHVAAGQPLARLDSQDLGLRVDQAQSKLSSSQIKLQQLTQGAPSGSTAPAQAIDDAASQRYREVVAAAAAADTDARLKTSSEGAQTSDEVGARAAQIRLDQLLKDSNGAGVDSASSAVVQLQRATVHGAEIDLRIAQRVLDNATMRAPFDGVVQSVSASAPEAIASATPVVAVLDPSEVRMEATVDAADIGQVAVGQTARISLDDHPGQTFSGRVAAVAAGGSLVQGVVSFPITVSIDAPDAALVPGLAARAAISGVQLDGVILLPAGAVRREGRDSVVDTWDGATTQPRLVHVGISNSDSVEIVDGVSEGDLVLIPHTSGLR